MKAIAAALAIFVTTAQATVLVKNDETQVTQAEFLAEVERSVPLDRRAAWLGSPKNIATMLEQVLVYKTLAARAEKANLQNQADVAAEISTARARALAKAYSAYYDAKAEPTNLEKRAEELYKVNPQRFTNADEYDTTQLIFSATCEGGAARAMERANSARERILKGEDIGTLAATLSDEPNAKKDNGRVGFARADQFTGEYAEVIREMKVGEVSKPFASPHGIHVVKLNAIKKGERAPYEKAKPILLQELNDQVLNKRRNDMINEIKNSPSIQYEQGFLTKLQRELAKTVK